MNELRASITELGTGLIVALVVLACAEVALMIAALVSVLRTPAERLRAPKWLWIVVVVFVNLIGPILYFAIGRTPAKADDAFASSPDAIGPAASGEVADILYGQNPQAQHDGSVASPSEEAGR